MRMVNMYDFIRSNSSYFDQVEFGVGGEMFIDYVCPITEKQAPIWSDKNCLMYVLQGSKGYASGDYYHESEQDGVLFIRKGGYILHQRFEEPYRALIFMFDDTSISNFLAEYPLTSGAKYPDELNLMSQAVVLELESSPYIRSIFRSSLDYLKQPTPEGHISLQLKFKELLVNLQREKDGNYFFQYMAWIRNDENVSFIKLMRENGHRNFTIAELARLSGRSLSSFKRIFKKILEFLRVNGWMGSGCPGRLN